MWCLRRLRVPWTAKRSNQSVLKEINPEYSMEELMLKLQYFGHLMWRADSLKKTLMLGKIAGRRRGQQRMRWLDSITDSMEMNLSKLGGSEGQRSLACCSSWGSQRVRHDLAAEQQLSSKEHNQMSPIFWLFLMFNNRIKIFKSFLTFLLRPPRLHF